MTTDVDTTTTGPRPRRTDKAQYGLAAALAVTGGYVVFDGTTLRPAFSDQPVQPDAFPYVVGGALLVLAVLLALATARGEQPEAESGEDVDLTTPADWPTVAKLVGVFALNIALVDVLGWAITGAFLFAGTAWVLGSRRLVLNLAIGVLLSVGTWYGFYVGLGVPIPAGILDGVL
jgi:putative tricarboxylic transport membrane protein